MSSGLKFLVAALFLLFAVPRLNLSVGPIPIYIIDLCILGAFYHAFYQTTPRFGPIPLLLPAVAIIGFAGLSEGWTVANTGNLPEPIYMFSRALLAVLLMFAASRLIEDRRSLQYCLQAITAGLLISSALIILTSLPVTRGLTTGLISYSFLSPPAEGYATFGAGINQGVRGISLIGYNILTGAFINVAWPLATVLLRMENITPFWRALTRFAVILAPFAILMTYSRGAILGMTLAVCGILIFGSGKIRSALVMAVIVCGTVISLIGWDSNLFFFERIENRTRAMLENPHEDARETERINAYTEPFEYVIERPEALLLGSGTAIGRMRQRGYNLDSTSMKSSFESDHAVFAMATKTYGMLAAFCYMIMMFGGLWQSWRWTMFLKAQAAELPQLLAQAAFASLLGLFSWFMLGHAAVSQPRGLYLFFFAISLLAVIRNLHTSENVESGNSEQEKDADPDHRPTDAAELYR